VGRVFEAHAVGWPVLGVGVAKAIKAIKAIKTISAPD